MDKVKTEETLNRSFSLDFLKIIGTTIIVFHHYQQITGAHYDSGFNFWGGFFYWGYVVELFFILSGYFMYKYTKIGGGKTEPFCVVRTTSQTFAASCRC